MNLSTRREEQNESFNKSGLKDRHYNCIHVSARLIDDDKWKDLFRDKGPVISLQAGYLFYHSFSVYSGFHGLLFLGV